MAEARQVLRQLLRAVDKNLTAMAANNQWRAFVLQQARASMRLSDPGEVQQSLQLAKDYTFMVENIAQHRALLEEYNLGLDPEQRNKRMVEVTARRVGFALPTEPKPSVEQQREQRQRWRKLHQERIQRQPQGEEPAAGGAQQQQQSSEQQQQAGQPDSSSPLQAAGGGEPLQAHAAAAAAAAVGPVGML